jgi:hypothetical protein
MVRIRLGIGHHDFTSMADHHHGIARGLDD